MPSRRLDINSLLCDDDDHHHPAPTPPPPPIVPEPVILAPHLRLPSHPPHQRVHHHDPSPSRRRSPSPPREMPAPAPPPPLRRPAFRDYPDPDPEPQRSFHPHRSIDSPPFLSPAARTRPLSSSSSSGPSRSPMVSYTYPPVPLSMSPVAALPHQRPPSSPYYQPSRHSPLLHRPSSSHQHQPQPQPRQSSSSRHRSRSNASPPENYYPTAPVSPSVKPQQAHPLGSLEALVQAATEERRRLSGDLPEPELHHPRRPSPPPPPDDRRSHPIDIVRPQQPRLPHSRSFDRLSDDSYPRTPLHTSPSSSAPDDFTLRSASFHPPAPPQRHTRDDSRLLLSPVESRTPASPYPPRSQQYDEEVERLRRHQEQLELDARQRRHHEQLLRQEQKQQQQQQQRLLEHQRAQEMQRAQELQRVQELQRAQELQRVQEQRAQEQRAQEQRAQERRAHDLRAQELLRHQEQQHQRALEQRAMEQQALEQRLIEQRLQEQKAQQQRAQEQRALEQQALEQRNQEKLAQEQRAQEQQARAQEQQAQEQQRLQEQQKALLKTREQPHIEAPHPSRTHLPSAARKPEPSQIRLSPAQIRTDLPYPSLHPPPRDDPRPTKKPRYSVSPSRAAEMSTAQDPERITKEREKMVVGELGYGRVEAQAHPQAHHTGPPSASSSSSTSGPRRPGSGNGRRPMAVADLVLEKPVPHEEPERPHRPVNHSMGRRSPPGSQAGRAMAARKTDEVIVEKKERLLSPLPTTTLPPTPVSAPPLQVIALEQRQLPWERDRPPPPAPPHSAPLKVKEEPFQSRPPSSNDVKPPIADPARRSKEPKAHAAPTRDTVKERPRSRQGHSQQEEDAHEWFLEHYADLPSPAVSASARPEPPHSPSPSVSPIVPTVAPPRPRPTRSPSPPPHVKIRTPTPEADAAVALEQELEELVAEVEDEIVKSPAAAAAATAAVGKVEQQDIDMDLDVDLAVQELMAETMEDERDTRKREEEEEEEEEERDVAMEVDVEDELLSLVDDRPPPPPPPPPPSARRTSSAAAVASSSTHPIKPTPLRLLSDAEQVGSPPMPSAMSASTPASALLSPAVPRQSSTRPTSERGSMPPPVSTSVGAPARVKEEAPKKGERSTSTSGPPAAKKKKEAAAKPGTKPKVAAVEKEKAPTKPRPKPAPKGKKGAADAAAPPGVKASKSAPAPAGKKNASGSRSRSASVMPGGSVGPEGDAKAEKQEEEEDSDAANDDDKLYCVCKTKYDEDRFMIACDRCDEWYHTQCVDLPDLEVDLIDQFICPPCIEKNPHLSLRTTYKQRCLFGLKHMDPSSAKACHKPARGAFSKYCSDECGVKYMQSRINSWAKKGGKKDKLWESVKGAEKREGVVICTEENGYGAMDVDGCKQEGDVKSLVLPKKNKVDRETERLKGLLDQVMKLREEIKKGMEVVIWREKLLELATERAKQVGQCGWDQRLCFGDEEWVDFGAGVLESYEEVKTEGEKEEGSEMQVDGTPAAGEGHGEWWCPGNTSCGRHNGWQSTRHKDVCKEKEKKEEALLKLTTREREIRKRIEDIVDPHGRNSNDASSQTPLKSANTKLSNGHAKGKVAGDGLKKGKKRKTPAS